MPQVTYHAFLMRLPWLRKGTFVASSAGNAYAGLVFQLIESGFQIAARDDHLLRLCAFRPCRHQSCTCLHVFWVRRTGTGTYVSYGVEPRFWFFLFCRHKDHLAKLANCLSIIRAASDMGQIATAGRHGNTTDRSPSMI